ncbi:MAG TPA: BTAD domain-containing putative transcriptional regulator, partial [Gaiellaceae bacterium]|nr:BTAD domain-containing putative transcriptional regulator [Gaiellaceae bacterium]
CYQRAAGDEETLPPGLAWRIGRLYWDRGQLEEAIAVYERGRIDGSRPLEEAFLLSWMSMPHWNLGDVSKARALAERALDAAQASGSSRALAAAHNALGVSYLGHDHALFERHIASALEEAEVAGDLLQIIRATISRAGPLDPVDQLKLLNDVIPLAELSGAALYVAGLTNSRSGANLALGRFDAAVADANRTLSLFEQHGSSRRSWPLMVLSAVARHRGDLASARSGYEEAIEVSVRDVQTMMPAQSELARLLAYDDPEEAQRLVEAAVELGRGLAYTLDEALLAAGWVALARRDRETALAHAREAAAISHRQRLRLNYAESLELQAMASSDPAHELDQFDEAAQIWRDAGHAVALARNRLAVARLTGDRAAAERATRALRSAGVREHAAGAAGLLACIPPESPEPLRVRTLGSFSLLREGHPVPLGEWRSRKARDLFKLLIARRGRAAPREYLMETLWPGEDPRKLGNRLSVALSNLRAVLDPDKRFPPEHFVRGGKAGVALRLENLPLDVEELLADAEAGLALLHDGREREARERLLAAEEAYAGDFLEEDAYEDWATVLREEARVAYIRVTHALAGLAVRAGEHAEVARYLLRVLERDAYDEKAHFGLVHALAEAGHHGEARRCYATYAERMRDIGVEAAPYPTPRDVSAV